MKTHICEPEVDGRRQVEGEGIYTVCGRFIDGKSHQHTWSDERVTFWSVGLEDVDCKRCLRWLAQWAMWRV